MAGNSSLPSDVKVNKMIEGATADLQYRMDVYGAISSTCFNKCIDKSFKDGELNMGENSCVDRCTSKYWLATNIIGEVLSSGRKFFP